MSSPAIENSLGQEEGGFLLWRMSLAAKPRTLRVLKPGRIRSGLANAMTRVLTLPTQSRVIAVARSIQDPNVWGGLGTTVFSSSSQPTPMLH